MKVTDLMEKLSLTLVTKPNFNDREIDGCYIGDLLSWVMAKAQSGNIWLTIQTNINIVAVASLTDCACVLLCEEVALDENALSKANEQDIIILKTGMNSYQAACALSKLL